MSNKDKSFIGILIIFSLILAYQQIQISKLERATKNIDIYSIEYDIRDLQVKLERLERDVSDLESSTSYSPSYNTDSDAADIKAALEELEKLGKGSPKR